MKIGSENRNKVIAASALGLVAVVRVIFMLLPSGPAAATASASPPESTSAPAASSGSSSFGGSGSASSSGSSSSARASESKGAARLLASADMSLDPTLRLQLLHAVEGVQYGGSGRNIFVEQADAPPIPTVVQTPVENLPPPGPPPPPPPPQITLKFFGYVNKAGEPKRAFLSSESGDVFIAEEGDIVNRRYKVVHINPTSTEIEDVLYNHSQSIPLTQQ